MIEDFLDIILLSQFYLSEPLLNIPEANCFWPYCSMTIACLNHKNTLIRMDAERWFAGWPALLSFATVYSGLGLDPDWFRAVFLKIADGQLRAVLPRRSPVIANRIGAEPVAAWAAKTKTVVYSSLVCRRRPRTTQFGRGRVDIRRRFSYRIL